MLMMLAWFGVWVTGSVADARRCLPSFVVWVRSPLFRLIVYGVGLKDTHHFELHHTADFPAFLRVYEDEGLARTPMLV